MEAPPARPAADDLSGREQPAARHRPADRLTLSERVDTLLLRLDRLGERPIISSVFAILILIVLVGAWWFGRPSGGRRVDELIPQVALATTALPVDDVPELVEAVVHVSGAVRSPGVIRLPTSARVVDAIEAAGGARSDADLDQLNLAAPISDGIQIRVPVLGAPPIGPLIVGADSLDPATASGPLDLNRAGAAQLEELPGVGPATAAAIIAWRDENGRFEVVEDLLLVPGIGPAKLAALAEYVTVQ